MEGPPKQFELFKWPPAISPDELMEELNKAREVIEKLEERGEEGKDKKKNEQCKGD
jgi:hypothetical protein